MRARPSTQTNPHPKGATRSHPRRGFTLIELMIVIAIIAILSSILLPNFVRARSEGRLTGCKTNLRNIATSLETYATDNKHRYPTALSVLTPQFIQSLPTCPSAGTNMPYINGFTSSETPDVYTLWCNGSYHGELNLQDNFPQFEPMSGGLKVQ
jgi:prepilin-type N-terminal cleavage/methylation domain-containing protein